MANYIVKISSAAIEKPIEIPFDTKETAFYEFGRRIKGTSMMATHLIVETIIDLIDNIEGVTHSVLITSKKYRHV